MAPDRRHFGHTDGTSFFWLGDTWRKNLFDPATGRRFAVSATPFDPPGDPVEAGVPGVIRTDEYHAPDLPSPQDWALVLERLKP